MADTTSDREPDPTIVIEDVVPEKEPFLQHENNPESTTSADVQVDVGVDINSKREKKKEMKLELSSVVKDMTQGPPQRQLHVDMDHLALLQKQQSSGPLRVAIFIKKGMKAGEGGSYVLELEKGRSTTAGEIKDKMIELLSIPKSSAHMFAIWFISPYLELQLKYHHVPFYLRKQWRDLLKKHSNCPHEEQSLDEPVIVFQRNSFITVAEEQKETEHNVLKRLFEEASYNVLKARYPITIPVAEMLGGIILKCYEGEFNANVHQPGIFKRRLNEFLPYYAIGSNKISQYIYSSGAEQRLLHQFEVASKTLSDHTACYKKYLEECYKLDFYGCAFFRGTCFQEGTDYKIWKREQLPVSIGINRFGITLFKGEIEEVLTHLAFNEISWDYKDDEEGDDGNPVERFIIEYTEENESRQIQILSKQSCMMDAMVQSCVNFLNDVTIPTSDRGTIPRKKIHNISYQSTARV